MKPKPVYLKLFEEPTLFISNSSQTDTFLNYDKNKLLGKWNGAEGGTYKIQAPIFIIKFDRAYISINIIERNMIEEKLYKNYTFFKNIHVGN